MACVSMRPSTPAFRRSSKLAIRSRKFVESAGTRTGRLRITRTSTSSGSLKSGKPLSTVKAGRADREIVQQLYSKTGETRRQIGLQRATKGHQGENANRTKSRQILHLRRRRIYRGVEQPGSSSVRPQHIVKINSFSPTVQQLYSKIASNLASSGAGQARPLRLRERCAIQRILNASRYS